MQRNSKIVLCRQPNKLSALLQLTNDIPLNNIVCTSRKVSFKVKGLHFTRHITLINNRQQTPHLVTGPPTLHRVPLGSEIPQEVWFNVAWHRTLLARLVLETHDRRGLFYQHLHVDSKGCHIHWNVPIEDNRSLGV